jgi:hypothetical protein
VVVAESKTLQDPALAHFQLWQLAQPCPTHRLARSVNETSGNPSTHRPGGEAVGSGGRPENERGYVHDLSWPLHPLELRGIGGRPESVRHAGSACGAALRESHDACLDHLWGNRAR